MFSALVAYGLFIATMLGISVICYIYADPLEVWAKSFVASKRGNGGNDWHR